MSILNFLAKCKICAETNKDRDCMEAVKPALMSLNKKKDSKRNNDYDALEMHLCNVVVIITVKYRLKWFAWMSQWLFHCRAYILKNAFLLLLLSTQISSFFSSSSSADVCGGWGVGRGGIKVKLNLRKYLKCNPVDGRRNILESKCIDCTE